MKRDFLKKRLKQSDFDMKRFQRKIGGAEGQKIGWLHYKNKFGKIPNNILNCNINNYCIFARKWFVDVGVIAISRNIGV